MATQTPHRATCAPKARVVPTFPGGNPRQGDGECLRLQGLVAAYHRNLKHVKTSTQRAVLQKALQRVQAELRLARRQSRRPEAA